MTKAWTWFLALALLPGAGGAHGDLREESHEAGRAELNALGQRNNLDALPIEAETLVLDAFHGVGVAHPVGVGRSAYDLAPSAIAPGHGNLYAWYGLWEDYDADGVVDPEVWELVLVEALLAGRVEPGTHPQLAQNRPPEENEPDFHFRANHDWYEGGSGFGFVIAGGSLVESLETRVVAAKEAADAADPWRCVGACLVDVDRYAALAPEPVAAAYGATFAPLARSMPPVSLAAAAWAETFARDTPLAGVIDAAASAGATENEDEWLEGNGASQAAVGRPTYALETRHVFDARFVVAVPAAATVVTTRDREAGAFLAVEATLGLWRDRDADGEPSPKETAGVCPGEDPSGAGRPRNLPLRITWATEEGGFAVAFDYADPAGSPGRPTGRVETAGTLEDALACAPDDRAAGRYRSLHGWWFPAGVPALRLEVGSPGTPAGNVTHASDGIVVVEPFWDADRRPRPP